MEFHHSIQKISFEGNNLLLTVDGQNYSLSIKDISPRLYEATEEMRNNFEVDSFGYGIHWPSLDEDLAIDGLIGIKHAIPETLLVKA